MQLGVANNPTERKQDMRPISEATEGDEGRRIIETYEEEPYPYVGAGIMALGPEGEDSAECMRQKEKRNAHFKRRMSYRECIPCDRCYQCIQLRRYNRTGRLETTGFYCLGGECEVEPYHTCNQAWKAKNGRVRVVIDMNSVPTNVLVEHTVERGRLMKAEQGAAGRQVGMGRGENEYVGGSSRAPKYEKLSEGAGTMSPRLIN